MLFLIKTKKKLINIVHSCNLNTCQLNKFKISVYFFNEERQRQNKS
jgi:hypothetical protein